jgi:hypothetical protein
MERWHLAWLMDCGLPVRKLHNKASWSQVRIRSIEINAGQIVETLSEND